MKPATESAPHFTRPTTDCWQTLLPGSDERAKQQPPFQYTYPAPLPNGQVLELPIRAIPGTDRAVASLIANHASFGVIETLVSLMAPMAAAETPDCIVGLPTLGLAFAPNVAERLGHQNFAPLGYSRKFWYSNELSVPVQSITSPGGNKSLYIDPNIVPRLSGKRVVLVDDAISSGTTAAAAFALLGQLDCKICGFLCAMRQGVTWREKLNAIGTDYASFVRSPLAGPIFEKADQGWVPLPGTLDAG
jgi:adenine/guanine phosphoribosyltransferase-like PRPP-binding protein